MINKKYKPIKIGDIFTKLKVIDFSKKFQALRQNGMEECKIVDLAIKDFIG